jgi:CheY-like chemotaxis protein
MKQTVLVVEDEAFIRLDAVEVLEDAGYEAIEARTADEALAVLQIRHDIDLVWTDVNMPGSINGLELSKWIAIERPGIGVVITSGMVRPAASSLPPNTLFFDKPYSFEQILGAFEFLTAPIFAHAQPDRGQLMVDTH